MRGGPTDPEGRHVGWDIVERGDEARNRLERVVSRTAVSHDAQLLRSTNTQNDSDSGL